jgi:hypothetical protein
MKQSKRRNKIPYNQNDLKIGSVIIRVGTVTPERMEVESEALCEGWDRIRNVEAGNLDRALRAAGWHMMYLAQGREAVAVGSFEQETVERATASLLGKLKSQMFNCVELTEISYRNFIGVPYVHVAGHARHIQREMQIESYASRKSDIRRGALGIQTSEKKARHVTA